MFLPFLLLPSAGGAESVTRTHRETRPAVGAEAEVATGDVLLVAFEREEIEFARLTSDVKVAQSGKVLPKGLVLEASLEVGSGRKEYCKGVDTALYCLQDRDNDGLFDKVQILGGARPLPRISGHYALEYQPGEDRSGWRRELVYQGAAAGVVRLTYNEFGADWSQPRMSQDLAYDVPPSGAIEVVYKGAKLQFLEATSNSARYRVVSAFESRER
jgi:hypothetical protein